MSGRLPVITTRLYLFIFIQRQFISDSSKSACRLRLDDVEVNILIYSLTMFVVSFSSLLFGYFSVSVIHSYLSEMFWLLACSLRAFFLPVLNRWERVGYLSFYIHVFRYLSVTLFFTSVSLSLSLCFYLFSYISISLSLSVSVSLSLSSSSLFPVLLCLSCVCAHVVLHDTCAV